MSDEVVSIPQYMANRIRETDPKGRTKIGPRVREILGEALLTAVSKGDGDTIRDSEADDSCESDQWIEDMLAARGLTVLGPPSGRKAVIRCSLPCTVEEAIYISGGGEQPDSLLGQEAAFVEFGRDGKKYRLPVSEEYLAAIHRIYAKNRFK